MQIKYSFIECMLCIAGTNLAFHKRKENQTQLTLLANTHIHTLRMLKTIVSGHHHQHTNRVQTMLPIWQYGFYSGIGMVIIQWCVEPFCSLLTVLVYKVEPLKKVCVVCLSNEEIIIKHIFTYLKYLCVRTHLSIQSPVIILKYSEGMWRSNYNYSRFIISS